LGLFHEIKDKCTACINLLSLHSDKQARSVGLSISQSVCPVVSPAKMAEQIEMLFEIWTRGGPKQACIRWECNM